MKLRYELDEKCFNDMNHFNYAIDLVSNETITADDVEILINSNISRLYSDLRAYFWYNGTDWNSIYKKDNVINYIKEWYGKNLEKWMHYFNILIDNNLISNCGSGYMFDKDLLNRDGKDWERSVELRFKKRIRI